MTASTRVRLQTAALALFAERGYAQTSVADIATAAGVSHMTFFRHFPTKESVVTADLFDPVIAAAIEAQPLAQPPLRRAVYGLLAALDADEAATELATPEFRLRVQLATSPELRGAVWASTQATTTAMAAALRPGANEVVSSAVAAAVWGAGTAALGAWVAGDGRDAGSVLREALLGLVDDAATVTP